MYRSIRPPQPEFDEFRHLGFSALNHWILAVEAWDKQPRVSLRLDPPRAIVRKEHFSLVAGTLRLDRRGEYHEFGIHPADNAAIALARTMAMKWELEGILLPHHAKVLRSRWQAAVAEARAAHEFMTQSSDERATGDESTQSIS